MPRAPFERVMTAYQDLEARNEFIIHDSSLMWRGFLFAFGWTLDDYNFERFRRAGCEHAAWLVVPASDPPIFYNVNKPGITISFNPVGCQWVVGRGVVITSTHPTFRDAFNTMYGLENKP
jgi:hypothetical protein